MENVRLLFTEHYSFVFFSLFTLWLVFFKILSFFTSKLNIKQWENWATGANCIFILLAFAFLFLYVYWGVGDISSTVIVIYFFIAALSYEDILGVNRPEHWPEKHKSYLLRYWWISILPLFSTLWLYFYRLMYVNRYSFKYLYLTHLSLLSTLINIIMIGGLAIITVINLLDKASKSRKKSKTA